MGVRFFFLLVLLLNPFALISLLLFIRCYVLLSMGNATTSRKFWGSFVLLALGNKY